MVNRIVVLPDYQGIGISKYLLNVVGKYYKGLGCDFRIKTSSLAMKTALCKNKEWVPTGMEVPKRLIKSSNTNIPQLNKYSSNRRVTFSFRYIGSIILNSTSTAHGN